MPAPELAIIIVSYNTRELTLACLRSIQAHVGALPYELVVVDNASVDGSVDAVRREFPQARVQEEQENLGFGRANNAGVAASTAPWLMFLNSDAQLRSDTAGALVAFLQARPDAAAVGPQVLLPDGAPQPKTCGHLPGLRRVFNQTLLLSRLFPRSRFFAGVFTEHVAEPDMEVGWISGVCMVLRREAFAQVGGFDPEYFLYAEDLDLCRRLRGKGWTIHRLQAHAITHVCGASTRSPEAMLRHHVLHQRNYLRLLRAHNGPCGYACACGLLAAGLAVRVLLRGLGSLLRRQGEREAAAAAWQCLRDLLVPGGALPGENHAHRD